MTRIHAGMAAAAVAALLAGTTWIVLSNRAKDPLSGCRAGQVAGDIGGAFTLVDQTGATVTDLQVISRPSLVYFGYTYCPDICPLDVARNAEAVDILEERGVEVTPVFISIDPGRDTPDVLAEYAEAMHPGMIALTGTEDQVRAASLAYKTYYRRQQDESGNYLMDHSTFTYLVLPEKGFVEFFRRDVAPDEMADRVACFLAGT